MVPKVLLRPRMTRTTKRLGLNRETLKGLTVHDLAKVEGAALGPINNTATSSAYVNNCGSLYDSCKTVVEATCTVVVPGPIIIIKL